MSRVQRAKGDGGKTCSVSTCRNYYRKTKGANVSYYAFPKDHSLRRIWIEKCHRGETWIPRNPRICSVHFAQDQYLDDVQARLMNIKRPRKLKADAVPSLNLKPLTLKNIKDLLPCEETSPAEQDSVVEAAGRYASQPPRVVVTLPLDYAPCNSCRSLNVTSILLENTRLKRELQSAKSHGESLKRNLDETRRDLEQSKQDKAALKAILDNKELSYKTALEQVMKYEAIAKSLIKQELT